LRSYRKYQQKACAVDELQGCRAAKKIRLPPAAEPDLRRAMPIVRCQRPKNSHSSKITGIGTPKSQSRIPRPIVASMIASWIEERERERQVPTSGTENASPMSGIGH
jgi:hypothetical protein